MLSLLRKANSGKIIDNFETVTKQIQRDIEEQLFSNTGMFKPWQFLEKDIPKVFY